MAISINHNDNDSEIINTINTTPLVDVMLVLLIIFLITIPTVTASIKIELPRVAQQVLPKQIKSIHLEIDLHGKCRLNEKQIEHPEQLRSELVGLLADNPILELHIYGDADTHFGDISPVMEMAQHAGIKKIRFMTDPKESK